ncbi:thiopeptide-type bacteriocin biosynthesis protein [Kitasatospora sp. MAP12-15]|uniref:lantibiotic dehydratase n=1 Tax=unclassified Kitasatospora TaxID=2633591 RepID=UPI0024761459|nr:lantibiotic dehydratase [Kitasatospora sp. MAP12-44]MDH6111433.1 thiopeptide-type bacteriocin biosynthesis protein [Kitasatospora sp. MAP12-44]
MQRFTLVPGPVAMARIPLLPANDPNAGEELLAEGLFLASRDLDAPSANSERAELTRAAYALRARSRTTPHGIWAAATTARLEAGEPELLLGEEHRCVTLPGPGWLAAVADRCLDAPGVLEALTLTTNLLAVRRGKLLEVEHPGAVGTAQLGTVQATELSIWLLELCDLPGGAPVGQVLAGILERWPGATSQAARTALVQMIRTGLLLPDLLPADPTADPLEHLTAKLPATVPLHGDLLHLREVLRDADTHPPGGPGRLPLLHTARKAADAIHPSRRPLTVDTIAQAQLRLPTSIGSEAARAVELLWRIGQRTPPLRAWTAKFHETYGPHRMVPLLEAIDPAVGIGPTGPEDAIGASSDLDDQRSRLLLGLLTGALSRGGNAVDLTDEMVDALAHNRDEAPPRTAEVHVRVLDTTTGPLELVVGPHAAQDAGSAAARFARHLPALNATMESGPGLVSAEVVCRPLTTATGALAVETGTAAYRIPIGVPLRDGDLDPRDLLVTTTSRGQLALYSSRLQRQVRPVLLSRITRSLLPPAAQLLHLLGHADERPWHPWSWGPAGDAPYTPRVTYRSTVLAPQRWQLPQALHATVNHRARWLEHLADWRSHTATAVPDEVVVEERDRHLPLDLRLPEHRELLRRSVRRGCRTVAEVLGGDGVVQGPRGRHQLELVVPLYRRGGGQAEQRFDPRAAARPRAADTIPPGGTWLSLALPVPARLQDQVLAQLPPAPDGVLFYWLRYTSAELGQHLRLRYRAAPEVLAGVQQRMAGWADEMAHQHLSNGRLSVLPYQRETQRYGGPEAIAAAEELFAADAALTLAIITELPDQDHWLILAAHCAAAIASGLRAPAAARPRPLLAELRRQRETLRARCRAASIPAELTNAWTNRQTALATYRPLLTNDTAPLCASDAIHLHCNRLLGTDPAREQLARSLATDLIRHG